MASPTPAQRTRQWDDTWFLHSAALAHGLDCVLAANGTLLVGPPGDQPPVCLAQGVLPTTSQATAAVLAEQDLVREMLRRAGLPTPSSRTLPFVDGIPRIRRVARELGYPVIARGVWVTRRSPAPVRAVEAADEHELTEAVAALRTAAGPRSSRPWQSRGRLMVERRVAGAELHALVVDGRVLAAGHARLRDEQDATPEPVPLGSLAAELRELLTEAVRALPDLPVATVHLAVEDPTQPAHTQSHAVTALDMHPRLAWHEQTEPGAGARLAAAILELGLAGRAGLAAAPRPRVQVRLRIGGLASAAAAQPELSDYLAANRVEGPVAAEPAGEGELGGVVEGAPDDLAAVAGALFEGKATKARPLYVEQRLA